jgi:hypothetical protein
MKINKNHLQQDFSNNYNKISLTDLPRTLSFNILTKKFSLIENFDEIYSFFQKYSLSNTVMFEIYQNIFSFMMILKIKDNLDIVKIIITINNILSVLSKINFHIRLNSDFSSSYAENCSNQLIKLLYQFNELIGCFTLHKLMDFTGLQSTPSYLAYMREIRKRLESDMTLDGFCNKIFDYNGAEDNMSSQEKFENFFLYLCNNFSKIFNTTLISIKVTNPKNNFNYLQTKEKAGLKFPFFLSISIKISNFLINKKLSSCEIKIPKLLNILISKISDSKLIQIEPSNVKYIESEGVINIKTKTPLYIDENESNDYILNLVTKSELKRELVNIIRRLNLPMKINDSIVLTDEINFIIY